MAANNTFGTPDNSIGNLNGMFKETYDSKLANLIPEGLKLMKEIKFLEKSKQPGNLFHAPCILGAEHGVTFASSDEDAFNLNPAVAGAIKDAQVRGNPVVMRSLIGYTALSRAAQGGQAAFEDATKYVVANMLRSMSKKLEIEMFYGQMGYGINSGTPSGTVVTLTTASWAPGIWSGAEGMPIEIRDSAGTTSRGEFVISSVDMEARTITLTTSAQAAGVTDTDVIWHKGAYGNEFAGVHKIITNTGTLFNISAASYNLWKGNSYSASGALSFTKLIKAASRAYEKGAEGKTLALVNPRTWTDLLSDQASLRKYDASYSESGLKNGSRSLTFYSQSGEITIEVSNYVKEGLAFLLQVDDWKRVGSSDITFRRPGGGSGAEQFLREVENAAALEIRCWSDQALFCRGPGHQTVVTGIVNVS